MKSHVMGVDLGSTTAKTVILDLDGELVASNVVQMGSVSGDAVRASMAAALQDAGIKESNLARAVSTGYGRRMVDIVDKSYTEITCHARGAAALVPGARLVIDIGGQDSKVIAVDDTGLVETFAMNDRCAGGTGKFLEVLARALEVNLQDMGPLAMEAKEALSISSMCATFAETEVISLLAEGRAKPDILAAVHAAIAKRTFGLVSRVGKRTPVVMTGGVAKNVAAVHYIEKELGVPLRLAPTPQIAGALGAAIIALDEYRANARGAGADEEDLDDGAMAASRPCSPACKGQQPPAPELGVQIQADNIRVHRH
jgi:(R)-2-hydroxyacyl-CoA dehydratese activating ATPase